jgi:DNA repair protein RadC
VHNDPEGDPTASLAEIEITRVIVQAAKPTGIAMHDHNMSLKTVPS